MGKNGVFRKFFETGNVPSFILWGPPGVGKTTLAKIVATQLERPFFTLSAVTSGVKDVREVIESARKQRFFDQKAPLLFIDEIHRFNKSQQDSLLGAVEQGVFTLIGATTENPSFEVISPLLSRCQVYILKSLEDKDLQTLLDRALTTDTELKARQIEVKQTGALFKFSGGDARKLLNILDILAGATEGKLTITDQYVTDCLQQNIALYDKNGEQHYDVISAFIKSVRGSPIGKIFSSSTPNALLYHFAVHSELTIKCVIFSFAFFASLFTSPVSESKPNFLIVPVPCHNCTTFTFLLNFIYAIGMNSLSRKITVAVAI